MTKLSAFGFAFAACFGTMAMLANSNGKVIATAAVEARYAADGAFRDGLYLGKLAAVAASRRVSQSAAGTRSRTAPCSAPDITGHTTMPLLIMPLLIMPLLTTDPWPLFSKEN